MTSSRRTFVSSGIAAALLTTLRRPLMAAPSPSITADELWYDLPAARWLEALPLGNGRLGAMLFGDPGMERLALSEATAWSGAPETGVLNPAALPNLSHIRELLFAGEAAEAGALCQRTLLAHPKNFGTNLPLPELQIRFAATEPVTGYRRSLDLAQALATVRYRRGTTAFYREVFASHADDLLVVHLSGDQRGTLRFNLGFGESIFPSTVSVPTPSSLLLRGDAFERQHSSGHDGVHIAIRVNLMIEGGTSVSSGTSIAVQGATDATILVAVATSFGGDNPEAATDATLARVRQRSYHQLRAAHIADHQSLYGRVAMHLGTTSSTLRQQSTAKRRQAVAAGVADPELLALFFQYGRYLTIAGARVNSPLPLALQGIWNDGLASSMGWTDDYHLDINTQQNYWPAEVTNLGESQESLFRWIERLLPSGRLTARVMYGADGWVAHTVANPWGYTAPGSGSGWGLFVCGGVWIAQQLWQHFEFTGDRDFLRSTAYPILREAAQFFLAYLTPEPTHGWLVTGPSDSPENWYRLPNGNHAAESMGNTCDRAFVYALFTECITAAGLLNVDQAFQATLSAARTKLSPFQIGRGGRLQEWIHDYDDADPNHRHTSHLVALYPLDQISPRCSPALARAAERTLELRMTAPNWEQSEWGRANLVAYAARLLQGEKAHTFLTGLLANATDDNLMTYSSAGVAGATSNIFALDGNTAGTAGIAEMLLQSQGGEIVLLPALPRAWPEGFVRGLCARGGYVVDLSWRAGSLVAFTLFSKHDAEVALRYGEAILPLKTRRSQTVHLSATDFRTSSLPNPPSTCTLPETS